LVICNLQKTPLADIADINIFGKTDVVLAALIEKLGFTIPEWKLKRKFKIGNLYNDEEKIWRWFVRGVDRDNEDLPLSLFKSVNIKLPKGYSKKSIKMTDEPFTLNDIVGDNNKLDITFSFRKHYDEPDLTIDYDLLFEGEGRELTYMIEFSPINDSWEYKIVDENFKPNDGTYIDTYVKPSISSMELISEFNGKPPTPRMWCASSICYDDDLNPYLVISGGTGDKKKFPFFSIYNINNRSWDHLDKNSNNESYSKENLWGHSSSVVSNKPKEVYIFGGWNSSKQYNSMKIFNFEKNNFTTLETNGKAPSPRSCHSATVYGSNIVVFGGSQCVEGKYEFFNDTYLFDTENNSWNLLKCSGDIPCSRSQHSAFIIKHKLYILGGYTLQNGVRVLGDIYVLNIKNKIWKEIKCGGDVPRAFVSLDESEDFRVLPTTHTSSIINEEKRLVLVYGICHYFQGTASLYLLDAKNWIWTNIENNLPGIQCHTSSVVNENEVLVFGGYSAFAKSNSNELIHIHL